MVVLTALLIRAVDNNPQFNTFSPIFTPLNSLCQAHFVPPLHGCLISALLGPTWLSSLTASCSGNSVFCPGSFCGNPLYYLLITAY